MKKSDLIKEIAEKTKIKKTTVKLVIDEMINSIKKSIEKWKDVKISGLGKFVISRIKERKWIDLKTWKTRIYPSRRKVIMRLSRKIKQLVK